MMMRIPRIGIWTLLAIAGMACENEEDYQKKVDRAIREALQERIAQYDQNKQAECNRRILEAAKQQTDSIILAEARLAVRRKAKPPKPEKPEKPDLNPLTDTAALKPVLPDSLRSPDTNATK